MLDLNGVSVAMVTPLANHEIDITAAVKLMNKLIATSVNKIVMMGTTGEAMSLSLAEREKFVHQIVPQYGRRIVVGTGFGNNLTDTIALSRLSLELGAAGVIVITPCFGALASDAMYHYYAHIAESINGPLILYDFPAMTGNSISPDTLARLITQYPQIVGLKLTDHSMERINQVILSCRELRPDFQIVVGYEDMLMPGLVAGAVGTISGMANFASDVLVSLLESFQRSDTVALWNAHRKILQLSRIYEIEPSPFAITKYATAYRYGLPYSTVLLPSLPISQGSKTQVEFLMQSLGLGPESTTPLG